MTNKEKLSQLKIELEQLKLSQLETMKLNPDSNEIKLSVENIIQLQGINDKISSTTKQISELSEIVRKEEREEYGYTVFGKTYDDDGKIISVLKIIPYSLKEKYLTEFDILNSATIPDISDIERFLNENVG